MSHAPAQRPRRILIVDDNLPLAENVAEILAMDGFITEIAGSAEEALTKAVPVEPDIVVTDYRLPGANGANLLRQLRAMGLRVRAIVISGYSDGQTIADAESAGATFIGTPLNLKRLHDLIRQHET